MVILRHNSFAYPLSLEIKGKTLALLEATRLEYSTTSLVLDFLISCGPRRYAFQNFDGTLLGTLGSLALTILWVLEAVKHFCM